MKKIVLLVLTCLLCFGLVGCSNSPKDVAKKLVKAGYGYYPDSVLLSNNKTYPYFLGFNDPTERNGTVFFAPSHDSGNSYSLTSESMSTDDSKGGWRRCKFFLETKEIKDNSEDGKSCDRETVEKKADALMKEFNAFLEKFGITKKEFLKFGNQPQGFYEEEFPLYIFPSDN